jgi:hypothetical protein
LLNFAAKMRSSTHAFLTFVRAIINLFAWLFVPSLY